jgi:putative hydrolase of the HAD superfamily
MIKAFLIDADGVTLVKQVYFSEAYSKDFGVPLEKITPFFKKEFTNCQLGKTDLKKALSAYLNDWGWGKSIEELLQYWFEKNTLADEKVISSIQKIRKNGIKCYLATNQEKYRAEYILNNLSFKDKFDGFFFSCEIGYLKSEENFFEKIIKDLELKPGEIKFFDDEEKNIATAEKLGIETRLYAEISDLDLLNH